VEAAVENKQLSQLRLNRGAPVFRRQVPLHIPKFGRLYSREFAEDKGK
jgi:hypothetical protein